MEQLPDDFLDFVSEFTDVDDEPRKQVIEQRRVNALKYDHEVRNWFSDAQIKRMYEVNPIWRAIEEKVYGDLFT